MNNQQREDTATLEILQAIENKNNVTQRHLADQLGVALGLANSYLKRCVRKGLIKIHQAPANRYLYYVTPKGFTEKSRLTAQYISASFDFYRKASNSFSELFQQCQSKNHNRILLAGISELAEIASLRAHDHDIKIVGVIDPCVKTNFYLNIPVQSSLEESAQFDICVLTSLNDPSSYYDSLVKAIGKDRVFVPSILGISK